ncbi:MAG: TonB-dependent receptor [Bacteroidales bacterium]|nr:TonB-dependent receptor [Bacteroidales bacterium]
MRKRILLTLGLSLLLCLLAGPAASARTQGKLYDLDLSIPGATVSSFTAALTGQTGVLFSYETDLASKALGNISIKESQASLESILTKAFSGKGITWKVVNRTVVLTAEQQPQEKGAVVTGRVVDSNGDPLPGAGVIISGTTKGTTTDADGRYSVYVAPGQSLEFSFIGYATQVIPVGKRSVLNVALENDQNILDDVVVVGYGTQSRKTLSTAIAKVDGEKLMDAPVSTVGDALKGKVTGLRIASNNNLPGESPRFLIRGGSSINRSNDPLFLVDGVERGIEDLNPNDIESIEVLKDAASSAIYGSRASNGVILVTTKRGNAFKQPQVVFDSQVGFTSPARTWKLANATEFLTIIRPAAFMGPNAPLVLNGANGAGIGNTEASSTYSTRYLVDGEAVPDGYLSMADPIDPSKTIIYTDHDWQKEWYHPSLYHKQYVGVNGGNKDVKYAASVGYMGDEGMVAMSAYNNFTMHGNTAFNVTKWLTASTTFDFSNAVKNPMTNDYFTVLGRGIMMSPTHIGKYPDGTFATGGTNKNQQTAEFYETFYDRETQRHKFMGSMNLKAKITDWLTGTVQYAMYDNSYRGSYYTKGEVNGSINFVSTSRSTTETRTQTQRQNFQAYLTADKSFGKHRISGTAGYDWSKWHYWYLNAANSGSLSDKVPILGSGGSNTAGTMSMSNQDYETALISYFGRIGYNFADRYILSATFRADGSSLFLGENKWGYFPSVSAAWVISEEPFFKVSKDKINMLKIRASLGQTGNNDIARTDPLGAYSASTYDVYNVLLPSKMVNTGLRWETTTQLDLGVDVGLYNDRVRIIADYYDKVTNDLIYGITLPDTGQIGSVNSNVGSVRFWGAEFELHTVNVQTRHFSWETDFTYSYSRNKILSLPDEYKYQLKDMDGNLLFNDNGEPVYGWRIGGYTTANGYRFGGTAVGEPLGRIWGYKVAGILQTDEQAAAAYYDTQSHGYRRTDGQSIAGRKDAGDFEWVNRYGTAKTSDGAEQIDATDMFLLGNVMPHSTGGINNTIRWNRVTFNIYFDYALGHSIYNYMKTRMIQNTLGYSNSNVDVNLVDGCWRKPGDENAKWARFFPNDADYGNRNYSRASDFNVENASYLCLRDASIYYDLPDNLAKKIAMKKITVGVTGNTLWYFTRLSGAISPETGISSESDSNMYSSVQMGSATSNLMPAARKVLFNLKLTF